MVVPFMGRDLGRVFCPTIGATCQGGPSLVKPVTPGFQTRTSVDDGQSQTTIAELTVNDSCWLLLEMQAKS